MNLNAKIASVACLVWFVCAAATDAQTIAGTVRNLTTAQPASGDDVILLRLGNGMEEQSRTKTDAQGAFAVGRKGADGQYLVRVMHQGVNYDKTVTGTAPLEIGVVDAVSKIKDLSGNIGMVQMESVGKILKVTEMYSITNPSNPPVTQAGPHNFEIFLPPGAAFDTVEAKRAEGIWIKTSPQPVPGRPGSYSVNFPIRPGDTLFKATYHLPYSERMRFHLKVPYPIKKFAVIHPPSMVFRPLQKGGFMNPGMANGQQIEKAVSEPLVGEVPAFEISGVGTATQPAATAPQVLPPPSHSSVGAPATSAPATPADAKNDKSISSTGNFSKTTLWLSLLIVAGLLGCGAWFAWKARRVRIQPAGRQRPLVEVLKEELFQLEVDRARGSISPEEYAATKQALNHTLARAVAKTSADS